MIIITTTIIIIIIIIFINKFVKWLPVVMTKLIRDIHNSANSTSQLIVLWFYSVMRLGQFVSFVDPCCISPMTQSGLITDRYQVSCVCVRVIMIIKMTCLSYHILQKHNKTCIPSIALISKYHDCKNLSFKLYIDALTSHSYNIHNY